MALVLSVPRPYDNQQVQDPQLPHIKVFFARLVKILSERGVIELIEDLYIDSTTIRSRAARRRIKWCSNAEKFGSSAKADIREGVQALLEQVENGDSMDDNNVGHVTYSKKRVCRCDS